MRGARYDDKSCDARSARESSDGVIRPFLRYCTVGVGNVALDFFVYTSLARGWIFWHAHYLPANTLTFIIVVHGALFGINVGRSWSDLIAM